MIINFSVTNFGSIKDKQTLSFEADKSTHLEDYYVIKEGGLRLLKVALIYGANASGKTTVLKALDFLRELATEPKDSKNDTLDFEPFLFDAKTPTQNSFISIEFLQDKIKYYYEIEFNKKAIIREKLDIYNPRKSNVFDRETNLENKFTEIKFGRKIKVDKTFGKMLEANTLWNNTVLSGYMKTNIDINELGRAVQWFLDYNSVPVLYADTNWEDFTSYSIEGTEVGRKNIVNILNRAGFNISDIIIIDKGKGIHSDDFIVKFEHTVGGTSYHLPLELESEGTRRCYNFAGLLDLLNKEAVAIYIDELDASLHPDLYRYFILLHLQNSKKSQLIATTNNREILNDKDMFRDDAIWITDKSNEDCATKLYSFASFDTSVIRDTTNRLNAYKSGKLGGVPNLGDIYMETNKTDAEF